MNPAIAKAIADYRKKGGRIVKLPETVTATADEIVAFLESAGMAVKRFENNWTTVYVCHGRQVKLRKLVEIANQMRRAQQLPPFAVRV